MNFPAMTLPAFSQIKPEAVESELEAKLQENREGIKILLARGTGYTWDNLVQPLEEMGARLGEFWGPIDHLNAVVNSPELRKAYNVCLPKLTAYYSELGQNHALYDAFLQLKNSAEYATYHYAQQQLINLELRDFKLSGVALPEAEKKQFAKLQEALSEQTTKFEENVLDATNAWTRLVTDATQLVGIPEHAIAQMRQEAENRKMEGWLLTLQFPCYQAVITYADNASLRQEIYQAYVTRASDQGVHKREWDNTEVMAAILHIRHEMANLLQFKNYGEKSLATKMAKTPTQVLDFLRDLAKRTHDQAIKEIAELQSFAEKRFGVRDLETHDVAYYSEKLRQEKYQLSQEDLRPYFPEPTVLAGLFELVHRLFGITIKPLTGVDVWHKDVRFYQVFDEQGQLSGQFYLDLFARANKRSGAWMGDCRTRRFDANHQLVVPIAFITCNFSPPGKDKPSLLTHDEVTTLFHEFGHAFHHLLTKIDYAGVAGINGVPWDAVEFPSQFMEEWCWQRPVLDMIAKHFQTGETLPDVLFQRMIAAKNFQSGMVMLRQLEFALFDFRLHLEYDPKQGPRVQEILDDVREQVAVIIPPSYNRFQHGFTHIFAGGYAAGYYSYKWAEVLSCDAFSLFEEQGIFSGEVGRRFLQNVLEQGGARDPEALFMAFRGRLPQIDALLKSYGIA